VLGVRAWDFSDRQQEPQCRGNGGDGDGLRLNADNGRQKTMVSIESLNEDKRLALLRKMDWRVRHAADSILAGEYRSTFRGKGMEFDQVVPYEFGDDVRDIDWNVTARLGEPFRKKFVEEREVTLFLVFQDSPGLEFGSGTRTKRDCLLELALVLLLLGAVNRDRTALFYTGGGTSWYAEPVTGRGRIFATASRLLTQDPPGLQPADSESFPMRFIAHAAPRHSMCLWLSDFPPMNSAPLGWPVLQRRYQTMGFRVEDPWERSLPESGNFSAYDPQSGEVVQVQSSHKVQRAAHADWVAQRDQTFFSLFPNVRSRLTVSTADDPFQQLVRFMANRSKGGIR